MPYSHAILRFRRWGDGEVSCLLVEHGTVIDGRLVDSSSKAGTPGDGYHASWARSLPATVFMVAAVPLDGGPLSRAVGERLDISPLTAAAVCTLLHGSPEGAHR